MFAERLKELRKEKKITQVQLAEMLDVSKGSQFSEPLFHLTAHISSSVRQALA